jgi:hypothetical protein
MNNTACRTHRCLALCRLGLSCLLACGLAASAFAQAPLAAPQGQVRPARPFRALFGGSDSTSKQALDLSVSLSGNYNDSLTPLDPTPGLPEAQVNPWLRDAISSGLSAHASYTRRWTRGAFVASSSHALSYYPDSAALTGVAHSASVSVNNSFGQHLDVRVAQTASYSPFYGMGMFLGQGSSVEAFAWNSRYDVARRRNLQLFTTAEATAHLTRRISLGADYGRQELQFTEEKRSSSRQSVGGRLQVGLTRNASVRVGYSRYVGDYGTLFIGGVPVKQHDIDAGLDFNRALSLTRRTTFGFSTGATTYTTPLRTYYRGLVNAHLAREIGRSWTARTDYRRGLQWIQGFPEPVFSDSVTLGAGGYLGSRAQLSFGAAYSDGEAGLSGGSSGLKMYTGHARLRVALSRFAALSAQYVYYHQKLGAGFPRPAGVPGQLDRQTVLAGVDLWLPLLR